MKTKIHKFLLIFACIFSFLALSNTASAYQCRWVHGYWHHGYYHKAHRVCWHNHHGHRHCAWRHGHRVCWYR